MQYEFYLYNEQTGEETEGTWEVEYTITPAQDGNINGSPDTWSPSFPAEVTITEVLDEQGVDIINTLSPKMCMDIEKACLKDAVEIEY